MFRAFEERLLSYQQRGCFYYMFSVIFAICKDQETNKPVFVR